MTDPELETRFDDFQRVIETRDVAAAQDVLDDGYALVLVQPVPMFISRQEWLAALPDYVVHEWTVRERFVDVDGDTAAVLTLGFQRAVVRGQPRDGLFVISDIWRLRAGSWRVWRRHSSPQSAGEMPGD